MAIHSLYPGFVKIAYTSNGHPHTMVLPVKPEVSGSTWALEKVLGGSYDPWTDAVDAFVLLQKGELKTTDSINTAELWTLASESADPLFREVYAVSQAGTGSAANVPYGERVITFRTAAGGLLRHYLMEGSTPVNVRDNPPFAASAYNDVALMFISSDGFVFGRDGGQPITPIRMTSKTNDALRKKYISSS
jgi:hypothetical protein